MPTLRALRERYRSSRAVRAVVDLVGMVLLVTMIGAYQTRNHPRGSLRGVTLRTLDGAPVSLSAWRGRTTLVEFWAPWCTVCKAQTDNLARARRLLGSRANVVSVAAAFEDVAAVRRSPLAQHAEVPVLLADDDLTRRMNVRAFPTVFVLDAEGNVVNSLQGYTTTAGLVLRALWHR